MSFTSRDDFLARVENRLAPPAAQLGRVTRTDFDLNPEFRPKPLPDLRPAAVLVGLQDRGDDFGVLFTERPTTMPTHAGQVAFPGGKIDAADKSAADAALREAEEEVGVPRAQVRLIGQADPYETATGYLVSLFIGLLPPQFEPTPDPHEVAGVFETPLSFLMQPENHERHEKEWGGKLRSYYAMPHNGKYIWGATAGMIKALYDRLYSED